MLATPLLLSLAFSLSFSLSFSQPDQRNFARTELYEEQLLMQELQLDQQQTQARIQELQVERQFAVRGSSEAARLDQVQADLLLRLQQDALQFQDLQARLQLRVLQQQPSTPFLFRPQATFQSGGSSTNEIRRRQLPTPPPQSANRFPPPPPSKTNLGSSQDENFQQDNNPFQQRPQGINPAQPQQNPNVQQAPPQNFQNRPNQNFQQPIVSGIPQNQNFQQQQNQNFQEQQNSNFPPNQNFQQPIVSGLSQNFNRPTSTNNQNFQQQGQNFQNRPNQNFQQPGNQNFQQQQNQNNFQQQPQNPNFPPNQNAPPPPPPPTKRPSIFEKQPPRQQQQQQQQQQVISGGPCRTQSGLQGTCTPLARCLTFYTEVAELRKQPCQLGPPGQFGVCCPPREGEQPVDKGGASEFGVLRSPSPPRVVVPPLTPTQLNGAGRKGLEALQARLELAAQLFAAGIVVGPGSAANLHQEFFQTDNDTLKRGEQGQSGVDASVSLVEEFQLTPEQGAFALPAFSILNTVIADTCPPEVKCDPREKYRRASGECNNLQDGRWGRAGVAHQRILPPKYGDGVNSPRTGANGVDLPSPRVISRSLTGEGGDLAEENLTLLVMQWGQFLDHDLTHTPISKGPSQSGIACCTNGRVSEPGNRHPDCFPITLPRTDPVFTPLGEECMEFVRSLPAPRPQCNFGPREQMNQITGYMDASNVYGSSSNAQRELRLFQGGFLRAQQTQKAKLLLPEHRSECTDEQDRLACFKAGDGRVNEQIQLTVMHTVWMREHNRIAPLLAQLNPGWSDEAVFQETRRIVVAQMQHITYNEWLPILLGREPMEKLRLLPQATGGTKLYDPALNGGITNVFATAAFRFGHSLIRDAMQGFSQFGSVRENLILHKNQFSPFVLYKEGVFDDFIRGLLTQTCQRFDRFFSKEVTDKLFQGDLPFGLDLVALNIQRGRDHGLPPYNDWREVCGLPRAASWEQLADQMEPQTLRMLQQTYKNVDEVDLFPALVSERAQPGALLGPTLVCLLSDQFARMRRGDRFFYEEEGQVGSFSPRQLAEIKKTSLARVLCDNSDDVIRMQPQVFFKSSITNQRMDCTSEAIPRLDLSAWANEPVSV